MQAEVLNLTAPLLILTVPTVETVEKKPKGDEGEEKPKGEFCFEA
jgi:hypothetical protein